MRLAENFAIEENVKEERLLVIKDDIGQPDFGRMNIDDGDVIIVLRIPRQLVILPVLSKNSRKNFSNLPPRKRQGDSR